MSTGVAFTVGNAAKRLVGSGRNSIYAAQAGVLREWPELDESKKIPENIFTHTKLDKVKSHNMMHFRGYVVSTKMPKTIAVKVEHKYTHPRVGVQFTRSTKLMTHDEGEVARVGDLVEVKSCRPLSRHKAFELHQIIRRENYVEDEPGTPCPKVVKLPPLMKRQYGSAKAHRVAKLMIRKHKKKLRDADEKRREEVAMEKINAQLEQMRKDQQEE